MLQPEIQISRDILCLPVTLLKALLRKTATRQVLSPTVAHRQRFCRELHHEKELGLLSSMDSSLMQSVKLWKVEADFFFKSSIFARVGIELEIDPSSWWSVVYCSNSPELWDDFRSRDVLSLALLLGFGVSQRDTGAYFWQIKDWFGHFCSLLREIFSALPLSAKTNTQEMHLSFPILWLFIHSRVKKLIHAAVRRTRCTCWHTF